ncbi:FAD-dependent oxidoreductase [Streptomyces sp. NPDC004610]|uniref:FAD-dependent oxidoreductase n=1 Tax=unclassified Streptomyces TaxID=2593676 RepID=UPI00339DD45B
MADVIVVGGGPVGLWTAAELRRAGVAVLVLEGTEVRDARSRAVGMSASTLETFATRGIAQPFIDAGSVIPTGHFGASSTRLDLSVLGTRHPFSLCIPQSTTETLLEKHCLDLGVSVKRGRRVIGLAQDADGVTVRVQSPQGHREEYRAAWVVGADGTRSVVRAQAGIGFPGLPGTQTGWLADVRLTREPDGPRGGLGRSGSILVQSIGDGLYRVAGVDTGTIHLPPEEPPSFEQVRQWAIGLLGDDFGMHSPVWISRYGDATRLADDFRKERVLLAGDAAHQFFPAGGQGMNTGIQDATNLAWKLAATIKGWAPEGLLDTYGVERRPAAQAVIDNTNAQLALFAARTPSEFALRQVWSEALALPELNTLWARRVTGFADPKPDEDRYMADPLLLDRVTHIEHDGNADGGPLTGTGVDTFALLALDPTVTGALATHSAPWSGRASVVSGLTATGPQWDGVRAALIRPDARVAWVARENTDIAKDLPVALGEWAGRG